MITLNQNHCYYLPKEKVIGAAINEQGFPKKYLSGYAALGLTFFEKYYNDLLAVLSGHKSVATARMDCDREFCKFVFEKLNWHCVDNDKYIFWKDNNAVQDVADYLYLMWSNYIIESPNTLAMIFGNIFGYSQEEIEGYLRKAKLDELLDNTDILNIDNYMNYLRRRQVQTIDLYNINFIAQVDAEKHKAIFRETKGYRELYKLLKN